MSDGTLHRTVRRRDLMRFAAAGAAGIASGAWPNAAASRPAAASEEEANKSPQHPSAFDAELTTADIIVEALISWGATHAFGVVGDGVNSIIELLRKRRDRIYYIGVRHEEAAAFMASGFAKHTGRIGVCVGTTGPGLYIS